MPISPAASPFRNFRTTAQRPAGRGGGGWTPAALGLRALYDYRNSTSTTMVDQSGNGTSDVLAAGGANAPLWLPYTVPQIYFPGTAGNTVSCTAPATAASYSAQPVGGGAPTTGVAASGAFTFGASNAGAWESVSILNGSAVEIARYSASLSTQAGHTDAYSVAWTVNRSASGRKTVVQSATANSARGLWLFGTDDSMTVPIGALPNLDANHSIGFVFRQHATPTNYGTFYDGRSSIGALNGLYLRNVGTTAAVEANWRNGTPAEFTAASSVLTLGRAHVFTAVRSGSSGVAYGDTSVSSAATLSGSFDHDMVTTIGVQDCELLGWYSADRALAASEVAALCSFYGANL